MIKSFRENWTVISAIAFVVGSPAWGMLAWEITGSLSVGIIAGFVSLVLGGVCFWLIPTDDGAWY